MDFIRPGACSTNGVIVAYSDSCKVTKVNGVIDTSNVAILSIICSRWAGRREAGRQAGRHQ